MLFWHIRVSVICSPAVKYRPKKSLKTTKREVL